MAERGIYRQDDSGQDNTPVGVNYLLVIGIDTYTAGISNLNNAKNDAESLMELLLSKYQFEQQHTYKLFNEKASKKNILNTFDELVSKVRKTDNLVFFYAGHGKFHDITKRGYWIPADAKVKDRSSYISNSEVIDFFNSLKALHVFGIVDSCFSAALFLRNLEHTTEELSIIPSRWLLTSGRLGPVSDGLGDNSPFTSSLLAHLEASNKPIWVSELCNIVLKRTTYNSKLQIPRGEPLQSAGHQGGQFVFYPKNWKRLNTIQLVNHSTIAVPERRPLGTKTMTISIHDEEFNFKVNDGFASFKLDLKELSNEDLKQGIRVLREVILVNSKKQNELLLHSASYARNKADARKNLISRDNSLTKETAIRYAVTDFIDELSLRDLKPHCRSYFE